MDDMVSTQVFNSIVNVNCIRSCGERFQSSGLKSAGFHFESSRDLDPLINEMENVTQLAGLNFIHLNLEADRREE
jgi:hypothetical protein